MHPRRPVQGDPTLPSAPPSVPSTTAKVPSSTRAPARPSSFLECGPLTVPDKATPSVKEGNGREAPRLQDTAPGPSGALRSFQNDVNTHRSREDGSGCSQNLATVGWAAAAGRTLTKQQPGAATGALPAAHQQASRTHLSRALHSIRPARDPQVISKLSGNGANVG